MTGARCGADNLPGGKSCVECGTPMSSACPRCGTAATSNTDPEGNEFCVAQH